MPPDNVAVDIRISGATLTATAPVEPGSGLQKQIAVTMASSGSGVEVLHRLTNHNPWTVELAAWGLTVLAPGGIGFTGLPPRGTHPEMLAPTNPLVIWAFTDLSDRRWQFTRKYVLLRQDAKAASPQKIGLFNADTFGAYYLGRQLFLKRYRADPNKILPGYGRELLKCLHQCQCPGAGDDRPYDPFPSRLARRSNTSSAGACTRTSTSGHGPMRRSIGRCTIAATGGLPQRQADDESRAGRARDRRLDQSRSPRRDRARSAVKARDPGPSHSSCRR